MSFSLKDSCVLILTWLYLERLFKLHHIHRYLEQGFEHIFLEDIIYIPIHIPSLTTEPKTIHC